MEFVGQTFSTCSNWQVYCLQAPPNLGCKTPSFTRIFIKKNIPTHDPVISPVTSWLSTATHLKKKSTVKHRVSKHSPKLPGWKLQTNWNCWSDRPVVCPIFTTSYHRVNLTCLHRKLCDRCVGGWEKNTSKTLFGWGLCLTPQSTDDPFLFRSCASGHKKSQSILFKEPCLKRKQSAKTIPKPTTLRILGSLQIATF